VHEARAGHLHDLGPCADECLDRLVEALLDARLVALTAELGDHPDPDPGQVGRAPVARGLDDGRHRLVDAGRVERVVAADDLVEERCVQDRARHRARLVE
jgi:hypothetical protein